MKKKKLKTIGDPSDIGQWVPTPTFLYRNGLYEKLIAGSQKKEFLDVGTGNGYTLKYLSENNFKGIAIDISKEALDLARQFISPKSKVKLKLADFYKMPTRKKYDQIFCFEVLEHVPDPEKFVRRIPQFLKSGGRVILSTPAHMKDWNKIDELKGHFKRFERQEMINMFEKSGMKIVKLWTYGFPFLRVLRWINSKGSFVHQSIGKKQLKRTKESSIVQEYNPKYKSLVNPTLLKPFFYLMDFFLNTDLGFGYLVEAVYKPSKKSRR